MSADDKKTTEELAAEKLKQSGNVTKVNSQKVEASSVARPIRTKAPNLDSQLKDAVQEIEPSKESTPTISNMTYKKDAPTAIECLFINGMYRFVKAKQNIDDRNITDLDDYMAQLVKHLPKDVGENILKQYQGKNSMSDKVSFAHDFVEKLETSIKNNNEDLYNSIIMARNYHDFINCYLVTAGVFDLSKTPVWNPDKGQHEILSYEKIFGNAVEKMKDVNAFNLLGKLELLDTLHQFLDNQISRKSLRGSHDEASAIALGEAGEVLLLENLKSLRYSIEHKEKFSAAEKDSAKILYVKLAELEKEVLPELNNNLNKQDSPNTKLIKQEIAAIKTSLYKANINLSQSDVRLAQIVKDLKPSKESTPTISNMTYKKDAPTAIECLFINGIYRFIKAKQNIDNRNIADLDDYMTQLVKHLPKDAGENILKQYQGKNSISDKVSFAHDFVEELEKSIKNNNEDLYNSIIMARNYHDFTNYYLAAAGVFDLSKTPVWNPDKGQHEILSYEKIFGNAVEKMKDVNAFNLLGKLELLDTLHHFLDNQISRQSLRGSHDEASAIALGETGETLLLENLKSLRYSIEHQKSFSEKERDAAIDFYFDLEKLEKRTLPTLNNNQDSPRIKLIKEEIAAIKRSPFLADASLLVQSSKDTEQARMLQSLENKLDDFNKTGTTIQQIGKPITPPLLPSKTPDNEIVEPSSKKKDEPTLVKPEEQTPNIGRKDNIAKLKEKIIECSNNNLQVHENKTKKIENKQVNYFEITDKATNKHVAEVDFTNNNITYRVDANCKKEEIILSLLKTVREPVLISSPNNPEHAFEILSVAKKHNVKALLDEETKALCIKEGSPIKEKYLALVGETEKPKMKFK